MKPSFPSSIQRDHIHLPTQFPMMVSTSQGVSPSFQRLHWHRALEINWITRGSGIYIINGREYPFGEGDLFLIDSDDLHRAYEGKDLEMVIVMFEPTLLVSEQRYDHEILRPFRSTGTHFSNQISHKHQSSKRLTKYIADMQREYKAAERGYSSALHGLLLLFLTDINRCFKNEEGEKLRANTKHLEQIRNVIGVMESQVSYPWTLKELANLVHLSPSRFSALFNTVVGTSPMNYLVQLRLEHAVEMLEQGEQSILNIAEASGFRNLSNFNRLFLQHMGVSPTGHLRRIRGGT
ncbi:AraC family transcriptional regulator [Paenibacillus segetis]|uniref:AraC family transcriptional regulator n=1 Tax=Paenibacillus segetis TaxID=1325360 RepID=A0ABQ1Y8P6_9BACL|nr:AraC family transcriptional regulator [Paenibacillus segetis]GGH15486.1 AraC family transcriptional regulator [Paenibacillus segetis]